MRKRSRLFSLILIFCIFLTSLIMFSSCSNDLETEIETGSMGLFYELNKDAKSYVLAGIGDCLDTEIVIHAKYNGKPVTEIKEDAFRDCKTITGVTIGKEIKSIGNYAFYGTKIKEIVIPDNVVEIGDNAFENCSSLEKAVIGNGVKEIIANTFMNCSKLSQVELGNSLEKIGGTAFSKCSNLKTINLPSTVTTIDSLAFSYSGLEEIVLPDSVVNIGSRAFLECVNLKTANIGNEITAVQSETFKNCYMLESVTIGKGVKTIQSSAFYGCNTLKTLKINASIQEVKNSAFYGCISIQDVYITDLDAWCKAFFYGSFANPLAYAQNFYVDGKLLTQLVVPEGVERLFDCVFSNYEKLTSVVLPVSMRAISEKAFEHCDNITAVYYKGSQQQWQEISFGNLYNKIADVTCYYYSQTEPALNLDGTAYDGNYWKYDQNQNPVVWVYENQ